MSENLHYSKAPIIEAVIDLRVKSAENCSFEQLSAIKDAIKDDYPKSESILTGEVQFRFGEVAASTAIQQNTGYKFFHKNGSYILQAQLGSFVLSALAPYDRWETFRDEARRLWGTYVSIAPVESFSRVAVRYINRIDIPLIFAPIEPRDYLKTYVEVSTEYKHDSVSAFFAQVQIPQPDLHSLLVLNQTRTQSPSPEFVSVILDIDLFSERTEAPWLVSNEESIWDFLEELAIRKNEIFEASITEKTRGMIR